MSDGKWLEKQVKKMFDREAEKITFDYERLYDARSARGMFPAQTSDYHVNCYNSYGTAKSIYIECKETENKNHVGIGEFPQFPRIYAKMLAGAHGILVVAHFPEREFRVLNLNDADITTRKFDLTALPKERKLTRLMEEIYK